MNAYKCDICGKYFEDAEAKTGSIYRGSDMDKGHHNLCLNLKVNVGQDWPLFNGDICPECMGYFCAGLAERGCQSDKVRMYAADYIRRCREEMSTKTLGVPVREEAEK